MNSQQETPSPLDMILETVCFRCFPTPSSDEEEISAGKASNLFSRGGQFGGSDQHKRRSTLGGGHQHLRGLGLKNPPKSEIPSFLCRKSEFLEKSLFPIPRRFVASFHMCSFSGVGVKAWQNHPAAVVAGAAHPRATKSSLQVFKQPV